MKYLANLISPYGKSKSVIVEASNYEQAQKVIDKEYPNHEDCIHALLDGGDTLTDLQAQRTAVKDKYSKG